MSDQSQYDSYTSQHAITKEQITLNMIGYKVINQKMKVCHKVMPKSVKCYISTYGYIDGIRLRYCGKPEI